MDTNRGAKGSLKDRIISLLYRIRYKLYLKKKKKKLINIINKKNFYINNDFIEKNSDLFLEIPKKTIKRNKEEEKANIKNNFYKSAYIFTNTIKIKFARFIQYYCFLIS